jgi:transcriptional regulator with XRE-family HTH domain
MESARRRYWNEFRGEPFADRLRAMRLARGLTQLELADLAGISHAGVYTIEAGRKRPRRSTLLLIAGALDVSEAELLAG